MHPIRRALLLLITILGVGAAIPAPAQADPVADVPLAEPIDFWDEATAGLAVSGTYKPIVGDFVGAPANLDEIIWYAPGAATDYLWVPNGDGTFSTQALGTQVSGTYTPLVGDFSGNSLDDIVWYAPGNAADYLWTANGLGFDAQPVSVGGTYAPVVADDAAGKDDIIWAKAGGGPGWIWSFEGMGTYLSHPITSPAGSSPLVGRFNDGVCADVFWYVPGNGADALWELDCSGNIGASYAQTVNGTYQPSVNDYTAGGDGKDDILWHRNPGGSSLWQNTGAGNWASTAHQIPTTGKPLAVAKNWGLAHFYSTTGPDWVFWKTGGDDYVAPLSNTEIGAGYMPIVGRFVGQNADIFWYKAGNSAERLFFTA